MSRSSFRENPGAAVARDIEPLDEAGARQCHLLQGQLGQEVSGERNARGRLQGQQGNRRSLANALQGQHAAQGGGQTPAR